MWNYHRDEVNNDANVNNVADIYRRNSNKTMTGRYFEFKAKIVGSSLDDNNALGSIFVVPFKYLSNF